MNTIPHNFLASERELDQTLAGLNAAAKALTASGAGPGVMMSFDRQLDTVIKHLQYHGKVVDEMEVADYAEGGREAFEQTITRNADSLVKQEETFLYSLLTGGRDNADHAKKAINKLHDEMETVVKKLRDRKTTESVYIAGCDNTLKDAREKTLACFA